MLHGDVGNVERPDPACKGLGVTVFQGPAIEPIDAHQLAEDLRPLERPVVHGDVLDDNAPHMIVAIMNICMLLKKGKEKKGFVK